LLAPGQVRQRSVGEVRQANLLETGFDGRDVGMAGSKAQPTETATTAQDDIANPNGKRVVGRRDLWDVTNDVTIEVVTVTAANDDITGVSNLARESFQ